MSSPFNWTVPVNFEITRAMKAFLVQLDVVWEDRPANFAKVKALLQGQSIPPGSLIVLPEMFATGFTMNLGMTIESDPSETEGFLGELARIHQSTVVGGLVRSGESGKGRNEAVVMGDSGKEIARYCKLQPFTFSGEADVHEKGEDVVVFELDGFVVSPLICYDLRFPEVFRMAAKRGAGLMVVIAQWPSRRTQHWVTLLQARAIENQAYLIGVNRCGEDPTLHYDGRSIVVDPHGKIIADAGTAEGVVEAELDPQIVKQWRADFPALNDIRTDLPA
jgi:predicted amidohydrolase